MSSERETARAHVQRGRELVDHQRRRIEDLQRSGKPHDLSDSVLKTFLETLRLMEQDFERIEQEAKHTPSSQEP